MRAMTLGKNCEPKQTFLFISCTVCGILLSATEKGPNYIGKSLEGFTQESGLDLCHFVQCQNREFKNN
jgi:hypothetical protein